MMTNETAHNVAGALSRHLRNYFLRNICNSSVKTCQKRSVSCRFAFVKAISRWWGYRFFVGRRGDGERRILWLARVRGNFRFSPRFVRLRREHAFSFFNISTREPFFVLFVATQAPKVLWTDRKRVEGTFWARRYTNVVTLTKFLRQCATWPRARSRHIASHSNVFNWTNAKVTQLWDFILSD